MGIFVLLSVVLLEPRVSKGSTKGNLDAYSL
jgi:hypothetical protein